MLPAKEYHRTLPAKRMAAGAVIRNQTGEILLVEPSYKQQWEIPGGVVESNESPLVAAIRELKEELNLDLDPQDLALLSIDYLHETDSRTEALMILFLAPTLTDHQIAALAVAEDELRSCAFLPPEKAAQALGPVVGNRLLRALEAINSTSVVYWEDLG